MKVKATYFQNDKDRRIWRLEGAIISFPAEYTGM